MFLRLSNQIYVHNVNCMVEQRNLPVALIDTLMLIKATGKFCCSTVYLQVYTILKEIGFEGIVLMDLHQNIHNKQIQY